MLLNNNSRLVEKKEKKENLLKMRNAVNEVLQVVSLSPDWIQPDTFLRQLVMRFV